MTTQKPTETNTPFEPIVMLPCPFCGEQPHGVFGPNEKTGLWRVECFGADYCCGDWIIEADSRDEAVRSWNRRKGDVTESIWCAMCGKHTDHASGSCPELTA